MTDQKPRDDRSTEEIMESIGRIVSEGESRGPVPDASAPPPAASRHAGDEDVLDLTEMVDEQGNAIPPGRAAGAPAFSFPPSGGRPTSRPAGGAPVSDEKLLEALRPMLQTWLDTHMPPIVERLVQRELDRAARRSEPE